MQLCCLGDPSPYYDVDAHAKQNKSNKLQDWLASLTEDQLTPEILANMANLSRSST